VFSLSAVGIFPLKSSRASSPSFFDWKSAGFTSVATGPLPSLVELFQVCNTEQPFSPPLPPQGDFIFLNAAPFVSNRKTACDSIAEMLSATAYSSFRATQRCDDGLLPPDPLSLCPAHGRAQPPSINCGHDPLGRTNVPSARSPAHAPRIQESFPLSVSDLSLGPWLFHAPRIDSPLGPDVMEAPNRSEFQVSFCAGLEHHSPRHFSCPPAPPHFPCQGLPFMLRNVLLSASTHAMSAFLPFLS